MKVIVVKNTPNSGKTKVFNNLLSLFPKKGIPTPTPIGADPNDFYVDFSYRGKLIGMISVGDTNGSSSLLQEPILLSWYTSTTFNIIICACHTAKTTYDLIKKIFTTKDDIIWFSNFTSTDTPIHDCLNKNSAQSIFNLIEDIINKGIV